MRRATTARLTELAGELSERDIAITKTVGRLRLLSGEQVRRLYFAESETPATGARLARRALARLVSRGVLGRLERRIGGVRAGAAGHVYFLAAAGQRLIAFWQGEGLRRTRSPYEPTSGLVRHTLGIAECYVQAVEADRAKAVRLLAFDAEPDTWRSFADARGRRLTLKPDARIALGLGGGEEAHAFLEIDCGTEGRRVLARQCHIYLEAYRAGIEPEVFPLVVWVTMTARRVELLREVCGSLPAEAWKLFTVTTPNQVLGLLTGTPPQTRGRP
ncbi:MAG TPA: replication-relaxation family protein [Solirubrobacteraceae bacterium]